MKESLRWLMRNDAGKNFGPVDTQTLIEWVNDNRIAPSFKLSSDNGNSWIPAFNVEALQMTWFAEISPGNVYGPVSKTAIENLIKEQALPKNAKVFQKAATKKCAAVPNEPKQNSKHDQQQIQALTKQIKEAEKLLKEKTLQLEELRNKAKTAEKQLANTQSLLSEKEVQLNEASKKNAQLNEQLEARVSEIENLKAALQRESEEKKALAESERAQQQKLSLLESEIKSERAKLHAQQEINGKLQEEIEALKSPPVLDEPVEFTEFEIVEPEIVNTKPSDEVITPEKESLIVQDVQENFNTSKKRMSLKELEAQARRELAALGTKGNFSSLFARK